VNGNWVCAPLGVACTAFCDASLDGPVDDGSREAGADAEPDARVGDASGDAPCPGTPPLICNGCCGAKYAADQCTNGTWTCLPLGIACVICDAGTDGSPGDASGDGATESGLDGESGDAFACTGTAPWCFGNDATRCCAQDPGGAAVCVGGTWMCGSAPAPGCNGVSCFPLDAGQN
jgi:hypothetical protein